MKVKNQAGDIEINGHNLSEGLDRSIVETVNKSSSQNHSKLLPEK
jgi:hypothetical protein